MKSLADTFTLSNGVQIPCIGFGTWQTPDGETAVKAVEAALADGYRHIDAAAIYGNEESVGKAIANSGVKRGELFVTSKLWNDEHGYESTLRAFDKTLKDLELEYLDLYLIHWPVPAKFKNDWQKKNAETWKAFEELYKEGRIRAIGVSNFLPHHVEELKKTAEIMPMVNQIEYHPGLMQKEAADYSQKEGMLIEAYSPLGTGKMLGNETLKGIAEKYGKSVAQICIRWVLQNGVLPLPKSVTPSRIADNAQVFDFELAADDMAVIDAMVDPDGTTNDPDNFPL
ncbi:aldo/keto reductase [Christensenella tenuis]|jgi:diketogulonate reductase-like aldo/keto reductase|uniref:Aldo/keto reductase n=1 Tax=Christensenella tenuis TaxID=2763033 RepID=A0ABR7EHA7_9FIRM|nr:aldo/keto reductase [Christensenella tenuis]MBC5649073.1 aldo/keto reductase [Christensenella tenuis]